jgi:hypothetical protein
MDGSVAKSDRISRLAERKSDISWLIPKLPSNGNIFQSDLHLAQRELYCRHALSYRDLEEMRAERSVVVVSFA